MKVISFAFAAALAIGTIPAAAQQAVPQERVAFRPGTTSTVITRTIRGRQTIDFVVRARAGQRLVASLQSRSSAAYFNILAPGEQFTAFYVGSNSTPLNRFAGVVPASGDLKFRVYLNRAAARRGEVANIRLSISVTGAGGTATQLPGGGATQLPGDALVPGTGYNATGKVDCRIGATGWVGMCDFGVRRTGNGSGSVTVTRPGGRTRTITFMRGSPTGYDRSQADNARFVWRRQGDMVIVTIGTERYDLPDAIISGG